MAREREMPFDLGEWRVDPARGTILRGSTESRLEPRLMDLLLLFAASEGRVVSKEEIIRGVWNGRVIGDDTLASAISRLRSALGESKDRRFIETLPKRGYRFVALAEKETERSPARQAASDVAGLVAKGRAAMKVPLLPSLAQARAYFEAAIRKDGASADAHAGLAEAVLAQLSMGQDGSQILAQSAKAAALAATAIDPGLAQAWAVLGAATLIAERDFAAADRSLQRALAIEPACAPALRYRAFALATIGRFVEAEREIRRAIEADPVALDSPGILLQTLLVARRYPQVIAEAKRVLARNPHAHEAWSAKGWAHHFLGENREAVDSLLEHLRAFGTDEATAARLAAEYAEGGFAQFCARGADLFETQRVLFVPRPLDVAMLRALAGQADAAFAALDLAASRNDPVLLLAPFLPHLDRLRNDPRFAALLERMRLVS